MKRHEAGNCEVAHTFVEPTAFPPQDEFVLPGEKCGWVHRTRPRYSRTL